MDEIRNSEILAQKHLMLSLVAVRHHRPPLVGNPTLQPLSIQAEFINFFIESSIAEDAAQVAKQIHAKGTPITQQVGRQGNSLLGKGEDREAAPLAA